MEGWMLRWSGEVDVVMECNVGDRSVVVDFEI